VLEVVSSSGGRYLVRLLSVDGGFAEYEFFHHQEGKQGGHRDLSVMAEYWIWALREEADWLCATLEDRYDP
jgi:hypothetical protein